MWSRSNPQRDELLSLCQEAGEQQSRVLLTDVSRGRAALPGPWAGALKSLPAASWAEAVPQCLRSTAVWWGLCRQPRAQTPWKGKGKGKAFPCHKQRLHLREP